MGAMLKRDKVRIVKLVLAGHEEELKDLIAKAAKGNQLCSGCDSFYKESEFVAAKGTTKYSYCSKCRLRLSRQYQKDCFKGVIDW